MWVFGLCACSYERKQEKALRSANTLNYSQPDEPRHLDPAFVKDLYEGIVSGFIYDGLVIFGKGADVQPGLAERWEISPGGRTYTFYLRDAAFATGKPVTSADVRYSFTRILLPETNSDRKWVLDRIVGAAEVTSGTTKVLSGLLTPDARTVAITLREPYPVFLTILAMPNSVIIPEGSAGVSTPDASFDQKPVGSGPWKLDKWLHDQRLEFSANPHYWGAKPKLNRLVYHLQVDDLVRMRQFETGNLDICQIGFQVHDNWMRDAKRAATTSVQELRTDFIGIMNSKPKLADRRIRQAITHAIDRQTIFQRLQKSRGVLAHGPVPPGIPGYRENPGLMPHDVARAKTLLAEARMSEKIQLNLWFRQAPLESEICGAVKESLAEAGIEVTLVPRDQAALRMGVHDAQADLYLGSWTLDYPDIENALYPPFHSRNIPRQGNGAHFANPEVDALLDAARAERDAHARIEKYQAAEDLIIEECPWVPLFHRRNYYAVQPQLKGWTPALIYNADRFNDVHK
ncbi:MAG: ABC transporter substrate-binding protein [Candidatus Sumerlaeaceae bacterium]